MAIISRGIVFGFVAVLAVIHTVKAEPSPPAQADPPPIVWAITADNLPCNGNCWVRTYNVTDSTFTDVKQLEGVTNILQQQTTSNSQTNFFVGCLESGDDEDGMNCKFGSSKAKWRCMSYDKASASLTTNQPLKLNHEQMVRMIYDFTNSYAVVVSIKAGKFVWEKFNCETGEYIGFLSSIGTVSSEFHQGADYARGYFYPVVDGVLYRIDLKTGDIAELWKDFSTYGINELLVWSDNLIGKHQNLTSGAVQLVFVDVNNLQAQYLTDPIGSEFPRWKTPHYISNEDGKHNFWIQLAHQNKIVTIDLNVALFAGDARFKHYFLTFLY